MTLSICIPTYNRSDLVTALVKRLLGNSGQFQICVHVDGSTDDTYDRLIQISDPRLCITTSANQGRASSLATAVANASGRFCMLFDDDDDLSTKGLALVLRYCAEAPPQGCVGWIYHLADESGERVGSTFPVSRSNFIALRADHSVKGDKKEVVLTEPLRMAMQTAVAYRRIPTSLYWARLALSYDVICMNETIGTKTYLAGGMSDTIKRIKRDNAGPLIELHKTRLYALFKWRFKSLRFAFRSAIAIVVYGLQALKSRK